MYTMKDFIEKKIAFVPKNKAEQDKFLQACEAHGLLWRSGHKPTKYYPDVYSFGSRALAIDFLFTLRHLCHGTTDSFTQKGYTLATANDFDFMQTAPTHAKYATPAKPSIHITTDGTTTYCVYKNGNVTKRTQAECSRRDTYDFLTGARIAFDRMLPDSAKSWHTTDTIKPEPAAPEYDEVIRPAKVGEKIKTVAPLLNNSYYEKDEIFTVDNKKNCCSDSVRVKGAKIPVDKFPNGYLLWPSEYVVLVPRHGTR